MSRSELLTGLRVLDLSLWQPGHYTTQLMASLGAEVIKVEPPGGDRMRSQGDRFYCFNGYKRSVLADLKTPEGLARVLALAAEAEVVVEGSRPGVSERLGVGYEALRKLNPAVVYCSLSGFGQTGPLAMHSGHDWNYQAYAGSIVTTTEPPVVSPALIADQGSGMTAAFAILAAVICARRTGEGEYIDVSMTDVVASWVAPAGALDPSRATPEHGGVPGMGVCRTRDGRYVVLGVYSEDHLWDRLVGGLGLDDLVGVAFKARATRRDECDARIGAAIAARDRDELVGELAGHGVPIAPVLRREEMLEHPNFTERGIIAPAPDGTRALGHPFLCRNHPPRPPGEPPELDELGDGGFTPRSAS